MRSQIISISGTNHVLIAAALLFALTWTAAAVCVDGLLYGVWTDVHQAFEWAFIVLHTLHGPVLLVVVLWLNGEVHHGLLVQEYIDDDDTAKKFVNKEHETNLSYIH